MRSQERQCSTRVHVDRWNYCVITSRDKGCGEVTTFFVPIKYVIDRMIVHYLQVIDIVSVGRGVGRPVLRTHSVHQSRVLSQTMLNSSSSDSSFAAASSSSAGPGVAPRTSITSTGLRIVSDARKRNISVHPAPPALDDGTSCGRRGVLLLPPLDSLQDNPPAQHAHNHSRHTNALQWARSIQRRSNVQQMTAASHPRERAFSPRLCFVTLIESPAGTGSEGG